MPYLLLIFVTILSVKKIEDTEHFSKQVTDARQTFFGFPKTEHNKLSVVSVGCERCLPQYKLDRKSFPQHKFGLSSCEFTTCEFVFEGEGILTLNGKENHLNPGSIFMYGKGIPHQIKNSQDKPMLKYFIVCAGDHSLHTIEPSIKSNSGFFQIRSFGEIMELFELILSNATNDSQFRHSICSSLANALFFKICEKVNSRNKAGSRSQNTYNRVLQHMRNNYFHIKSMKQLAKEVNIDPAYLSRIFRRFHKETPYKFLIRLKMSHAASLLLKSDELVKSVAYEIGFQNQFHFSRCFKSVYGISPEKFIQQRVYQQNHEQIQT